MIGEPAERFAETMAKSLIYSRWDEGGEIP